MQHKSKGNVHKDGRASSNVQRCLFAVLSCALVAASPSLAEVTSADLTDTTADAGLPRESGGHSADLLSAFYGLDDSLPFLARLICRGAPGKDGMPVIFSTEIDHTTLQAGDFRVTTASGATGTMHCVTLLPATDGGELRTVLLVGEFVTAETDPPVTVEIVGHIHSLDGTLDFQGAQLEVTPLAPGPSLVMAEIADPTAEDLGLGLRRTDGDDCPSEGIQQAVRVVWDGGVTLENGDEPGDAERDLYRVTVRAADGTEREITPTALADLGDGDNNHLLCLDTADIPVSVSFPEGVFTDPNDDLNPATSVAVRGALTPTATTAQPAVAQETRPNILLVLFDDVGFTGFGAYGGDARTPRIDALAQSGTLFSRYYSSPFCGPSRAMLMTGLDNHQTGMGTLVETVTPEQRDLPGYSMIWDDDQQTIASFLSEAGYQTYVSGKWGIGAKGKNLPDRFGFNRSYVMDSTGGSNYDHSHYLPGYPDVSWYEDGAPVRLPGDFYSSRNLVDQMIRYIGEGEADQPFFGFLSLQAIHIPVQAPAEFIDRYDGVFDAGWDAMREQRWQRTMELGLVPETTTLAPVHEDHRAWDDLSPEEQAVAAREMQVNAGMIEAADFHIGRLLDHLETTGQLENTIVVVTSDNGPESDVISLENPIFNLGLSGIHLLEGKDTSSENAGLPGSLVAIGPEWASVSASPFNLYKFYSSEGGLRVPLVIAGPGVEATGVQHAPVHVADLMPTLLDAVGATYDTGALYGRSILPVLAGATDETRAEDESFGVEVSGNAALYRGNWKLVRTALPRGDFTWRLYDLSVDPGETTDLSGENPALFAEMRAEYEVYATETGVLDLDPEDYAEAQLFSNLLERAIGKYWPYLAGLVVVLLASLYVLFRLARTVVRRPAH